MANKKAEYRLSSKAVEDMEGIWPKFYSEMNFFE